jgi:hypothetical protein
VHLEKFLPAHGFQEIQPKQESGKPCAVVEGLLDELLRETVWGVSDNRYAVHCDRSGEIVADDCMRPAVIDDIRAVDEMPLSTFRIAPEPHAGSATDLGTLSIFKSAVVASGGVQ